MNTHEVREAAQLLTVEERNRIDETYLAKKSEGLALHELSKRELQVAHKIMEGLPNKLIANDLFISERTVKFHCANIYKKLKIRGRSALIAGCFRTIYQPVGIA
ncbi:helix-turn-helix domain-containing protein [Alteromonas sp. A079]|uniref:helix-turn-helix domain-containing protein n=1 Tax=Alteromonas sp. A079 TaxID=3410268 RepID=UPI003BA2FAB9